MNHLKRVLIMAGGTGGHVFPGIAVAHVLQKQGVEVRWLGTPHSFESRKVPEAGIAFESLSIGGWRGKRRLTLLTAPFKLTKALFQAMGVIRRFKPNVVLGMGGFASGPGGIASLLLGYPLVIHEQNAIAGMTNRWLAPFATQVLQAFPYTFAKKAVMVGNPVREEIIACGLADKAWPTGDRSLHLLVLGGSLGAAPLNALVPKAIALLPINKRPKVWHQSGEKHFSDTLASWQASGVAADVEPFIQDMGKAYAWADVILCRAGALTVSELCAAGRGAILIPYPYAVDDHQAANAAFMVNAGAAEMIRQSDLDPERLASMMLAMVDEPDRCQKWGDAARCLSQAQAATKITKIVEQCQEACH